MDGMQGPPDFNARARATPLSSGVWPVHAGAPKQEGFRLVCGSPACFTAWLAAIAAAHTEVLVEMYWFADDAVGRMFAQALIERAGQGLDVFVLVDGFGSLESTRLLKGMREGGVQVRWYNPLFPWTPGFQLRQLGKRDHRKTLIVDSEVAFAGGINITDQGETWHDYCAEVEGNAAVELRALFFDTWSVLGGPEPQHLPLHRTRTARDLRRQARRELKPAIEDQPQGEVPTFQVQGAAGWVAHRAMRRLYLRKIRTAKRRILIENAYFVPDTFVRNALLRAARRGVEVTVIVPMLSDLPLMDLASGATFQSLMAGGVHIHLWTGSTLHAKAAVVDDWATLGSYNLDYRSLFHNLEVNVATSHLGFVEELTSHLSRANRQAFAARMEGEALPCQGASMARVSV